jgi:hypothetical protein
MDTDVTPTVAAIGKMDFQGNIIPATWYKAITFENGKTDLAAVIILAEIVYWYRPTIIRAEATGEVIGYKRKFKADKLQRSYQSFTDQFGLTKRQVRDACKRLSDLGLITLDFRTIQTAGGAKLGNVLFLEPMPSKLAEITNPMTLERHRCDVETSEVLRQDVIGVTLERQTNTETTTKTTTKNNTVVAAAPEQGKDQEDRKEQQVALDALLKIGWDSRTQAEQYAKTLNSSWLIGLCKYAEVEGLGAPWVHKCIKAGDPVPAPRQQRQSGDGDDRRRFITGEFAEYIQH